MSYIAGEIRSGEQWGTDKTPTAMIPVVFSVSLTPNPVVKSGKVLIQVFVQDLAMPIK
jgi:hypothetical protein